MFVAILVALALFLVLLWPRLDIVRNAGALDAKRGMSEQLEFIELPRAAMSRSDSILIDGYHIAAPCDSPSVEQVGDYGVFVVRCGENKVMAIEVARSMMRDVLLGGDYGTAVLGAHLPSGSPYEQCTSILNTVPSQLNPFMGKGDLEVLHSRLLLKYLMLPPASSILGLRTDMFSAVQFGKPKVDDVITIVVFPHGTRNEIIITIRDTSTVDQPGILEMLGSIRKVDAPDSGD